MEFLDSQGLGLKGIKVLGSGLHLPPRLTKPCPQLCGRHPTSWTVLSALLLRGSRTCVPRGGFPQPIPTTRLPILPLLGTGQPAAVEEG